MRKIIVKIYFAIGFIYLFFPIIYASIQGSFPDFPCFFLNQTWMFFYFLLLSLFLLFGIITLKTQIKEFNQKAEIVFKYHLDVEKNICALCKGPLVDAIVNDQPIGNIPEFQKMSPQLLEQKLKHQKEKKFIEMQNTPEKLIPKGLDSAGKYHIECLEVIPRKVLILHPIFIFLYILSISPINLFYINYSCLTSLYYYPLVGLIIAFDILYVAFTLDSLIISKIHKFKRWIQSYKMKNGPIYRKFREQVENFPLYYRVLGHVMVSEYLLNISIGLLFVHLGLSSIGMFLIILALVLMFIIPIILRPILSIIYKQKIQKIK